MKANNFNWEELAVVLGQLEDELNDEYGDEYRADVSFGELRDTKSAIWVEAELIGDDEVISTNSMMFDFGDLAEDDPDKEEAWIKDVKYAVYDRITELVD